MQPDLFGQSVDIPATKSPGQAGRLLFALYALAKTHPEFKGELAEAINAIRCKRVLRAIQRGAATVWEIQQLTKIPEATVHVYLHTLMESGKIRRVEGDAPNKPASGRGGNKPVFAYFPANPQTKPQS